MPESKRPTVLLTGITGYIGSLIAAELLAADDVTIVAPIRAHHVAEEALAPLRAELASSKIPFDAGWRNRLILCPTADMSAPDALGELFRTHAVDEVIHAAGCVDYYDVAALEFVNVEFTRALLEQAQRFDVGRFIFISTAFSSGYTSAPIEEARHLPPAGDPTPYTDSKRRAEWLVMDSGVPYLIVRPAVVIGDSRDGHYSGKRYGYYQLAGAIERLICRRQWSPEFHVVAPERTIHLVHQDAFQAAFTAARRSASAGSVLHVVSEAATSPTLRDLWIPWVEEILRPERVFFYDKMADLPVQRISASQRALAAFASVNIDIASHEWNFQTGGLAELVENGLVFAHATRETIEICRQAFVRQKADVISRFEQRRAASVTPTSVVSAESARS